MRWRALPVSLALVLSACAGRNGEAYVYSGQTVNCLLDDDLPARAWSVHVTADHLDERSGPLWCTLRMDTSAVADDISPWHDIWVDLWLQGTDMSEQHLFFQGPGSQAVSMVERYPVDCAQGEPCEWDFQYSAERRAGTATRASPVVLSINLQAVVALGDAKGAPKDPTIHVSVDEMSTDTGMP